MTATFDRPIAPATDPSHAPNPAAPNLAAPKRRNAVGFVWAAARLSLGWVFLWAFLDKAFGWGFSTASENAWINGGSPTEGFLTFGTSGPLAGMYQSLAGTAFADIMFMLGLGAIGLALLAGIGMRIAAGSGALLMLMMWSAALPPDTNPFMTYHIIYAIVLVGLALAGAGNTLGLGKLWASTPLVQRLPWLK